MRKPHYWRQPKTSSAPSNLLVVDTETYHGDHVMTEWGEWQTLRIGCALAYRLEKGKRTRIQRCTFTTAEQFWDFVESRQDKKRPLYIIGHNLPYDIGVLSGWRIICGQEYRAEKVCVSGQMFWIKGTWRGKGLNFLDTINYWHCALSKIGKFVGVPKMTMPSHDAPIHEWETYCSNDVEVTARGIDALIEFTRQNLCGPWQPSIAGNAFAAYRTRFMTTNVLVHTHAESLRRERDAYYGGIVDTNAIGQIDCSEVYELDVCSMYPAMCLRDLPRRWIGSSTRMGVKRVKGLVDKYMCIADVQIVNTTVPYPVRCRDGTYYPIGTYRTTLAHPELMDAISRGVVSYVYGVSWYLREPIFADYMRFFVAKKLEYNTPDNEAFSNVCKLYATNLYGKTGQLTHTWMQWGKQALQIVEQQHGLPEGYLAYWYDRPPDYYHYDPYISLPGLVHPLEGRTDYGVLEIRVGEHESRDSCPAIAACVTSYARVLMRELQRIAGSHNWYYTDTDSIWTNRDGFENLYAAGYVRHQELGYLDLKYVHRYLKVYGPKDYETCSVLKRKGIRTNAKPTKDGGWEQLEFPGALEQIRSGLHNGVLVKHITKHLHREITRCVVGEDGWTRPLVFPSECPERKKEVLRHDMAR